MKEVTAFSPGHITGFFEICDQPVDPLFKGSRGSGVSITKGVTTTVRAESAPKMSFEVAINNKVRPAPVSRRVITAFLPLADEKYKLFIDHKVEIPIGSGLGSSGAGALSLALALNEIFNLGYSRVEAAQIAHTAEVECKTGLGTVIAETFGGLEVRTEPGAPGVGAIVQIPLSDDYKVVCLNFGPISTEKMITNEELRGEINRFGGKLVEALLLQPTVANFMTFSRSFAERIGIISNKLSRILKKTDAEGLTCSMAMFGHSIFAVLERDSLEKLIGILSPHICNEQDLIIADIDVKGARIV